METTARSPLTDVQRGLVAQALPDAHRLAKKMAGRCPNLTLGELKGIAEDELLASLPTFDGTRGVSLFGYSRVAIEGRSLRASRRRAIDLRRRAVRPTKGGARAMLAIAAFSETVEEAPVSELAMATVEDIDAELNTLGAEAGDAARFGIALADDEAATPDSESARRTLRADLIDAFSQEDNEVVALVIALIIEDETWEVAAKAQQMSVSTAQRRVKKAFERMRARLIARGQR